VYRLSRKLFVNLGAVLAVVAVAAVFAAPASASEVAAKFSASSIKVTTSGMTLKRANGETRTCSLYGGKAQGGTSGSEATLENYALADVRFSCTGPSTLEVSMWISVSYNTVTEAYRFHSNVTEPSTSHVSPWGGFFQDSEKFDGVWVNGSGSTNSTIKYENTPIGSDSKGTLTLSGTFTATTSAGGLLTLSH